VTLTAFTIFAAIVIVSLIVQYVLLSRDYKEREKRIREDCEKQIAFAAQIYEPMIQHLQSLNAETLSRAFVKNGMAPVGVDLTKERAEKMEIEQKRKSEKRSGIQLPSGISPVQRAQMEAIRKEQEEMKVPNLVMES
jgi:hypothetical protein